MHVPCQNEDEILGTLILQRQESMSHRFIPFTDRSSPRTFHREYPQRRVLLVEFAEGDQQAEHRLARSTIDSLAPARLVEQDRPGGGEFLPRENAVKSGLFLKGSFQRNCDSSSFAESIANEFTEDGGDLVRAVSLAYPNPSRRPTRPNLIRPRHG